MCNTRCANVDRQHMFIVRILWKYHVQFVHGYVTILDVKKRIDSRTCVNNICQASC